MGIFPDNLLFAKIRISKLFICDQQLGRSPQQLIVWNIKKSQQQGSGQITYGIQVQKSVFEKVLSSHFE